MDDMTLLTSGEVQLQRIFDKLTAFLTDTMQEINVKKIANDFWASRQLGRDLGGVQGNDPVETLSSAAKRLNIYWVGPTTVMYHDVEYNLSEPSMMADIYIRADEGGGCEVDAGA